MRRLICITAVMAIGIVSCQKEKSNTVGGSKSGSGHPFTQRSFPNITLNEYGVGEWHNYYIDVIFDKISEAKDQGYTWQDARTNTFSVVDNIFTGEDVSDYNSHAREAFNLITESENLADYNDQLEAKITGFSGIPTNVKNAFIQFWSDCESVTTINQAQDKANWLKSQANNFSGVYKKIAIGSADVYEASFTYWYNNMDDWKDVFDDNSSTPTNAYTSVAGADGKGFATGALYGSMGGTATLPGVGTFSGWLGGGLVVGLGSSVGAIIGNVWDYFFG